jgi:hypothetical protein
MAQYATVADADAYFDTRLYADVWDQASPENKDKALIAATQAIDRLRFVGVRHSVWLVIEAGGDEDAQIAAVADQTLEFPRGSDTTVPADIEIACFEEALSLLDGKDPDQELEDLAVISQGYSSVRSTYDRSFAQEHLNAGIVSPRAWRFLKPYLRGGRDVKISRV